MTRPSTIAASLALALLALASLPRSAPAQDAAGKKPVKILGTFGMKEEDFGIAVRKEDADLLKTLNEGLKMLKADPYWNELVKKHLAK